MRRLPLLLLKAAISIPLPTLSLRSVNLSVVGERLSRFDYSWIVFAFRVSAAQEEPCAGAGLPTSAARAAEPIADAVHD